MMDYLLDHFNLPFGPLPTSPSSPLRWPLIPASG